MYKISLHETFYPVKPFLLPTTFKYTGCHTHSSPQDKAVLHYFSDKYFLNELLLNKVKKDVT